MSPAMINLDPRCVVGLQVMERAPWRMFAAIFKKKNVVGEKASRSAHD